MTFIVAGSRRRSLTSRAAHLSGGLTVFALLLLAAGPVGWRVGWWHFRFAFFTLMPWSAYIAVAAAIVALATLLFLRRAVGRGGVVMALAALLVSGVLVYVPWRWDRIRTTVPPIHDITTDIANPPAFVAVMPARQAEQGNTTVYNPEDGKKQAEGYPDIAPVVTKLPPQDAFARALETAKAMSGWVMVASSADAGRIEASQASRFFGFTDDVSIRVAAAPDGAGSRIDMRSEARQGRSDFGVNAARIRKYMAALKDRLDGS